MGEKTKLNMTCTLQVLRKRALENAWSWQTAETDGSPDGPGSPTWPNSSAERRPIAAAARPPPTVAAPSFANGNFPTEVRDALGDGCGCVRGARSARARADRGGDAEGAVAEATRALEEAVRGINDALEELRYELEDAE